MEPKEGDTVNDADYPIHQEIIDTLCEGCKGVFFMDYTQCYKICDGYHEEHAKLLRERHGKGA